MFKCFQFFHLVFLTFSLLENEGGQPSTPKVSGHEDGTAVESDTLLEGMRKTTKPSLSSEDDKNEDDDLLSKYM